MSRARPHAVGRDRIRAVRGGGRTIAARRTPLATLLLRPTSNRRDGSGPASLRPLPTLARNGGLAFFLATLAYNGGNFVFHMAMSRMLGPAGYGALGSLLGLVTIAVLPISALQAAVTQSVAERRARREVAPPVAVTTVTPPVAVTTVATPVAVTTAAPPATAAPPTTVLRPFLWTCAAAAGVLVVLGSLAPVIDHFLSLSSPVPLILVGTYVATSVATIVPQGLLIGQLRFRPVAISLVAGSVVRLGSGVVLVGAGLGLNAASAASALAGITSLAVLVWALRAEITGRQVSHVVGAGPEGLALRFGPAMLAVIALAGVSAFLGIDSLLARHYLSKVDAGYYVAAATAARVALFLPGAVAMTVFPRLAAAQGDHRELRRLLVDALAITAVLSGGAAAVMAAFPHLVITVLFGHAYQHASGPLAILSAAAAAMGVASVLVYFFLARTSVMATACWAAVVAVTVLIVLDHQGLDTIAWLTLGVTATMALVMAAAALGQPHPSRRRRRTPLDGIDPRPALRSDGGAARGGVDVTVLACSSALGHLPPAASRLTAALHSTGTTFDVVAVASATPVSSTAAHSTAGRPAGPWQGVDRPQPDVRWLPAGTGPQPDVRWLQASADLRMADLLDSALRAGSGRYLAIVGSDFGSGSSSGSCVAASDIAAAIKPGRSRPPDIVLAARRRRGLHATGRSLSWWLRHATVRSLLGMPARGTTATLLLARRTVLDDVLPRLAGPDGTFDLEVLVVAHRLGYRRVGEVAFRAETAPTLDPTSPHTLLSSLRAVLAIFYRLHVLHYYDGDETRVDGVPRAAHLAVDEAIG